MKKIFIIYSLFISLFSLYSQNYTLSGRITDAASGELLSYVVVQDTQSQAGALSNEYGFYSLTLPQGKHTIAFQVEGYKPYYTTLDLKQNILQNIVLQVDTLSTDSVVIKDYFTRNATSPTPSTIIIPIAQIAKMPMPGGEGDVMRALQLLPGVQFGQEGNTGLFVRGGSPDQNLVLLDEMPVYNVSHLFGFFSLFPPDAIKSVELIKGGFPAQYGGRLSSVINLQSKEGNLNTWKKSFSVGVVSSHVSVEGPIQKNKSACFISVRRTFIDAFLRAASYYTAKTEGNNASLGYYFYDAIAKYHTILSEKDRIYVSFYGGNDKYGTNIWNADSVERQKGRAGIKWGNITGSVRYNHLYNVHNFSNTIIGYTQYNYRNIQTFSAKNKDTGDTQKAEITFGSAISDIVAKHIHEFHPNEKHSLKAGVELSVKQFRPNVAIVIDKNNQSFTDTTFGNRTYYGMINGIFIEEQYRPNLRFTLTAGLRGEWFKAKEISLPTLQPRLSMRYAFSDEWTVKAAYSHIYQYLHLLSNSGAGLPTDLWVPATKNALPASSHQYVLGIYKDFWNKSISTSIEGYYKTMNQVIDYKDGSSFVIGFEDWEKKVSSGKGTAYGVEFFVHKPQGKWNGWLSYTLAWNTRQFADINGGKPYPFKYDRRHNFSIYVAKQLKNPNHSISATWMFTSGVKTTIPTDIYNIPQSAVTEGVVDEAITALNSAYYYGYTAFYAPSRNNYTLKPFHKLDIAYNMSKQRAKSVRTWSFGFYNVYARRNPYYLYFKREITVYNQVQYNTGSAHLREFSLLVFLPSVSYSLNF